ncbi:MAG: UDP-N-acetylmuramoyl-tripeptide--D-alanyl-D-alanine ligase [Halioglobus sp.]|nr:UDP-N-acetylmuramoyl-tripeptide--D-alanyl-D-alanine ligase [Halioglobus sp.]
MMRAMTLAELEGVLGARLSGPDASISSVSCDSRRLARGELFVALQGERFDGHAYLADVAAAGAAGAIVSRPQAVALPQLVVADTRRALGLLGAFNRSLFRGPLVGITGSSGKTTAKNMIRSVLAQRGETLATEGNFNNEIGVPLTLLRLEPAHAFAVVEMGAGKAGDVAWLCEIGRPTVSVLLNAQAAHLETFGKTIDDVAAAKGEIFDGLDAGNVAVINADQTYAAQWRKRAGRARVLDFGLQQPAAISASAINVRGVEGVSFTASTPAGDIAIRLSLPGRHNVANALAATAVGLACDLSLTEIRNGLEALRPVAGRLCAHAAPTGATVIDDCYNANPGSVRAAIDILAACTGRRTLVLGAMLELGPDSPRMHREIGEYAKSAGIERFWGVGPALQPAVEGFGAAGRWFADRDALLAAVQGELGADDTLLVKGSRSAGMEQVLQGLLVPVNEGAR